MKTLLIVPVLLALTAAKPGPKVASRGAVIDRDSMPVHVIGEGKAGARLLLNKNSVPGLREAAVSELVMLPGAHVPEHVHDASAEILYILDGSGVMTLDGKTVEVKKGMAIYIPRGVKHSFRMNTTVEPLRALQVYTPGGPEQRFTEGKSVKE